MKKIDFHIHTHSSHRERNLEYDLKLLEEYVTVAGLDAIAITNHNLFNIEQFKQITKSIQNCTIFPGVEVDLEKGHVLVISTIEGVEYFSEQCKILDATLSDEKKYLSCHEFKDIFSNHNSYLIIPHYKKDKSVDINFLVDNGLDVFVGEVSSPKKFYSSLKDNLGPTPMLFSDTRMNREKLTENKCIRFPIKQTYIDISEITIPNLKLVLRHKDNVFLNKTKSQANFEISNDGTQASSGLNVILGKRATGKTFLMDTIYKSYGDNNTKYIRQFFISQRSTDESFNQTKKKMYDAQSDEYLSPLKDIIAKVLKINVQMNEKAVDEYLKSLLEFASSTSLHDVYSNTKLFL